MYYPKGKKEKHDPKHKASGLSAHTKEKGKPKACKLLNLSFFILCFSLKALAYRTLQEAY